MRYDPIFSCIMLLYILLAAWTCSLVSANYKLLSVTPVSTGWEGLLELTTPGPFGGDVQYLALSVIFINEASLRISIRDAITPRWEIPSALLSGYVAPAAAPPNKQYAFTVTENPFGFAVVRIASGEVLYNTTISDLTFTETYLSFSSVLPNDHYVYGLGERIAPLRLPLRTYTIETTDWGTPMWSNLYGHHPMYMRMEEGGLSHIVMLWNSHPMDIVLAETSIQYKLIGGIIDVFIFLGPTPLQAIEQYTSLIGRPYMPPLWSVGFHQCRWGYRTAQYTLQVAQNYSMNKLPLDTIWNDIDWMENYFAFTFAGVHDGNRYNVSDVTTLNQWLDQRHMHHVYIVDPNIPAVLKDYDNVDYYPYTSLLESSAYVVHPAGDLPLFNRQWPPVVVAWPDWTNPAVDNWLTDNIARWGSQVGVPSGAWLDMNEPSAFCAGQITHKCGSDYEDATHMRRRGISVPKLVPAQGRVLDPNAVPHSQVNLPSDLPYPPYLPGGQQLESKSFNISSWHAIGRHYQVKSMWGRYEQAAFANALSRLRNKRPFTLSRATFMGSGSHGAHWLGDNASNDHDLAYSIPSVIAMGLFGVAMNGADICGFAYNTNAKLCARWMQLGTLYPFSRNHNTIGSVDQEPYRFGEPYTSMNRNSLNLRYSLLPYIYTLFTVSHLTGAPVWRALSWEFAADMTTWTIDRQVMIGPALLLIPILAQNDTMVTGYIPRGDWFDWYTLQRVVGGMNQTFTSTFDADAVVPLLIRGGYIVPTQVPQLTTFETWITPYTFTIALNADTNGATGNFVIDDGETIGNVAKGDVNRINVVAELKLETSTIVAGTITARIINTTTSWPLTNYSVQRINIAGLPLTSSYDPSKQPICLVSGSSGPCEGVSNALSVIGQTLQFNGTISMSTSFTIFFGPAEKEMMSA